MSRHEPEFERLSDAADKVKDRGDSLSKASGMEDLETPQCADIARDLEKRWDEAKDQVKKRWVGA